MHEGAFLSSLKQPMNETKSLRKSMALSALYKPCGMILSFLYTPLLLRYLGQEAYGVWSTILSVVNWIAFFDVGVGNGLRNTLTRYIVLGEKKKARVCVSTGYISLSLISTVFFIIAFLAICSFDVNHFFNTEIHIRSTLLASVLFMCINFVMSLSRSLIYAIQKAEYVGLMTVLTQAINLLGVFALSMQSHRSLISIAILVGISGIIVNLLFSLSVWKRYDYLIPQINCFNTKYLKDICSIGVKFFLIQISSLLLYSTDTVIISRLFGPIFVTPYQACYSMFGFISGMFAAMIVPLWSKYTVYNERQDYRWIRNTLLKMDLIMPVVAVILIALTFLFKPIALFWLHEDLQYRNGLISGMAVYTFLMIWGSNYSTALNGIGRIDIQLYLAVFCAVVNVPLSIFLGRNCGLGSTGVLLATILCMILTNTIVTIDLHFYLKGKIAYKGT